MRVARGAFTLIELLVVIAIISILAAILFPVFAQAKKTAKQIVCVSNMKQFGLALEMYCTDHDDMWVPTATPSDLGSGFAPQQIWVGYDNNNGPLYGGYYGRVDQKAINPPRPGGIDPYLKNEEIKRCPELDSGRQTALAMNQWNPQIGSEFYTNRPNAQGMEYGPGSRQMEYWTDGQTYSIGASSSEIEEPSNTITVWEHLAHVPMCNFLQPYDWFNSPPEIQSLKDHFHFLHREGVNTLWADTHVRRMTYGQLRRPMFSCNKSIYR
jgi:prepilin-type N-terminal cleavage/methylation domain-containing protein/prepilin-type processing-associated H-X9-DG protein